MTQLEKDQKRTDLLTKQQMLEDELRALEATPVTTYKVWEPKSGGWWDSVIIDSVMNYIPNRDDLFVEVGIAHPTKEAAERHHSFLVMLHDLHKFAVEHNEGWKPDFNSWEHKYTISFGAGHDVRTAVAQVSQVSSLPYFKSEEIAQKAIDTFGDRLKILFEYYNS